MATWSVRNVAIGESDFRNFSYWAIWYVGLAARSGDLRKHQLCSWNVMKLE